MRKNLKVVAICFTGFLFTQNAAAQDVYKILFSGCGEENTPTLEQRVRQAGAEIEPQLLEIVQNGPSKERLDQVRQKSNEEYTQRQARLQRGETLKMDEALLNRVRSESREDYVKRAVQNYHDGMVKQALSALAILKSDEGMSLLRKVSNDGKSRYREHARWVLRNMGN